MRLACVLGVALTFGLQAYADFSYTTTTKTGMAQTDTASKHYFKGQRMATETGNTTTVLDFNTETMTTIDKARKSYKVVKFADVAQNPNVAGINAKADVKETGQKKDINGYPCREVVMTMQMTAPQQGGRGGAQMQMEIHSWIASGVPGAEQLHAFYQKYAARLPWAALSGGANQGGMQQTLGELQRKLADMDGVTMLSVVKMAMPGMPAMTPQQQAQMAQARAQMEAMIAKGGPQADAMKQALARMPGGEGGAGGGMEITSESKDFSTASVPDSVFAIPAGFQQK